MVIFRKTDQVTAWIGKNTKVLALILESRVATVGMGMVLFWVLISLLSLFWTPYNPNATDFVQNIGPCLSHWMGTDHLGRDLLSRLMQGSQVVLLKTRLPGMDISLPGGVAIWGVFGSLSTGSFLGLNAG